MLKKVKNMMISKAVKVAEVFTKEEKGASDIGCNYCNYCNYSGSSSDLQRAADSRCNNCI